MSTKSSLAIYDDNKDSLHLYYEMFSDAVSLDVRRPGMQLTVDFPLRFAIDVADKLSKHVDYIRKIMDGTDDELMVMAISQIDSWSLFIGEEVSREERIQDRFEELKLLRKAYLESYHGRTAQV